MPVPPKKKSKSPLLIAAARRGDAARVRALLRQGCDPDEADHTGATALHAAIAAGHLAAAKTLVEEGGADINLLDKKGRTPYDIASDFDLSQHPPKTFFYLNGKGAKHGWQVKLEAKKKKQAKKTAAAKKTASRNAANDANGGFSGGAATAAPPKPKFTETTLSETFNPSSWIGKTEEMEKLWENVPKKLKAKFDFAAALSEARRQSMRKKFAIPKFKP